MWLAVAFALMVMYEIWWVWYFKSELSHIQNIREKIEDNPSKPVYMQMVWEVGYKFNKKLK